MVICYSISDNKFMKFFFEETKRCLIFYYHMYGSTMGTLNIKTKQGEVTTTVLTKSGNQQNTWHKAVIDLPATPRFNVNNIYFY